MRTRKLRLPLDWLIASVAIFSVIIQKGTPSEVVKPPSGVAVGGVQFDAVIALGDSRGRLLTHLFARYWVSTDYYEVAVVWAEPHGRGIDFPIYPPTLSIGSGENDFTIVNGLLPSRGGSWPKPLERQQFVSGMFGGYPIENLRFAEEKGVSRRLYASDFIGPNNGRQATEGTLAISLSEKSGEAKREVASLKAGVVNERVQSLQLFDGNHEMVKALDYEYAQGTNGGQLERMKVELNEEKITLRLPGKGASVVLAGVTNLVTEFDSIHHQGGRKSVVEYKPVAIGETNISLPWRIVVRGPGDSILRSAELSNYQRIAMLPAQAREKAAQFGEFTPAHRRYRDLLAKYWEKDPSEVSRQDAEEVGRLLDHFGKSSEPGAAIGEKLRRLNVLMELNRMIGRTDGLERHFGHYLEIIQEAGAGDLLLVGGACACDTLMLWGRNQEANLLLNRWLEHSSRLADLEVILRFASGEFGKGNFWTAAKLLEQGAGRTNASLNLQFECSAKRAFALHESQKLLETKDKLKLKIPKAQAEWIASSINVPRLRKWVQTSTQEARQRYVGLTLPSESQKSLMQRLDSIGKTTAQSDARD